MAGEAFTKEEEELFRRWNEAAPEAEAEPSDGEDAGPQEEGAESVPEPPRCADATKTAYRTAGWRLLDRFLASDAVPDWALEADGLGAIAAAALPHFGGWMDGERRRRRWSRESWRWLWQAAVFCLKEIPGMPQDAAAALDRPDPEVFDRPGRDGNPRRTSAVKEKRLPEEARKLLYAALLARGGKADVLAALWLEAGVMTGLRPSEWNGAKWTCDGRRGTLTVRSGKWNPAIGRGIGPVRSLVYSGAGLERARAPIEAFLKALAEALDEASARENPFVCVYKRAAAALSEGNLAAFGRRGWNRSGKKFTLYSARHQFTADVKSAGGGRVPAELLAAVLGHSSDETASRFYGRRAAGAKLAGETVPQAPPEQKARVKFRRSGFIFDPSLRRKEKTKEKEGGGERAALP